MVAKKLCFRWLVALVGLTLVCGFMERPLAASQSHAAQPVAVLSVASIDRLTEDLDYLSRAAKHADVGAYLQQVANAFLEAFDRTRPAGIVITADKDEFPGVGFLPVSDLDALLRVVRGRLGAEIDVLGNGIWKLELGKGVYLKQRGT